MDAWNEGYNAALNHQPVTDCPYRSEPNKTAYVFGYHEGCKTANRVALRALIAAARPKV